MAQLASLIVEFYSTTDPNRRAQLDQALTAIKKSGEAFESSFDLLDFKQPTSVQHFGASIIYETVRTQCEDCIANEQIAAKLKSTLIEKLTLGAHFQNQSVTNKLSSSLALFALYCIPDVWCKPVQDLTALWAGQPELLLRVLAEIAAEFEHVQMPLKQRNLLKVSLQKMNIDVINVIDLVLRSGDDSPSLKNAAIECVEEWLNLPSVELTLWQPILKLVFHSALNDLAALARILTVISSHDDLRTHPTIALDIATFITQSIFPVIGERLRQICEVVSDGEYEIDAECEDVRSVLFAIANISTNILRLILLECNKNANTTEIFTSLCSFFAVIASWPGRYPIDELVSDTTDSFWETLKDDLTSTADERISAEVREKLLAFCRPLYATILQSAIQKLSYIPHAEFVKEYDQQQRENFETYRRERRETAMHAFVVVGRDTLTFLNDTLQEAIETKNCCRCEAVLLLFERVADYLTEVDFAAVERVIQLCSEIPKWQEVSLHVTDVSRLGITLMRLLYSLSHLVLTSNKISSLGAECIELALHFLSSAPGVSAEALTTLEHYAEDRCAELISCMNGLFEKCYAYFLCEKNSRVLRLRAMKCVGYALSLYDSNFVLSSLDAILAPRLVALRSIAEGHMPSTSAAQQSVSDLEQECLFELGLFSALIATIQPKSGDQNIQNGSRQEAQSPVFVAMQQCVPLFQDLLNAFKDSHELVEKVCDALRSGLIALRSGEEALTFLDTYCNVVDTIIFVHPEIACKLAKAIFIIFGTNSEVYGRVLNERLKCWYEEIYAREEDRIVEDYIELAYHIVRKCWKLIVANLNETMHTLKLWTAVSVKVLNSSNDPSKCRESARLLSTLLKNCGDSGQAEQNFNELLHEMAENVIVVIFTRLQYEMMHTTAENLAEILMFFARKFPQQTRQYIQTLPNGQSPLVAEILNQSFNARAFKNSMLRFNMQMRKSAKTLSC